MFFRLTQRTNVQLLASKDHPHGRVVELKTPDDVYPGWCEIDEADKELVDHPVVARFLPQDDAEAKRLSDLHDAEVERDEAIAEARAAYAATVTKINAAATKDLAARSADWSKRREEAIKHNQPFDDPHPDPDVATMAARTSQPASSVVTTAALMNEPFAPDAQPSRIVAPEKPQATDSAGRPAGQTKRD